MSQTTDSQSTTDNGPFLHEREHVVLGPKARPHRVRQLHTGPEPPHADGPPVRPVARRALGDGVPYGFDRLRERVAAEALLFHHAFTSSDWPVITSGCGMSIT